MTGTPFAQRYPLGTRPRRADPVGPTPKGTHL
jgi:hypothetical protein